MTEREGGVRMEAGALADGEREGGASADEDAGGAVGTARDAASTAKHDGSAPVDAASAVADAAEPTDANTAMDAAGPDPLCEIGIADKGTGTVYTPLPDGEAIPLIGGSQAALLVELGLRAKDPPMPCDVSVVVRAAATGREDRRELRDETDFDCSDGWCALVPVYVPTSHLVDDPFDLDNLEVIVEATLRDGTEDGGAAYCEASLQARIFRF
jgi:hypothetical protein